MYIATCGIWKISSNLKQVINYTTDETKTKKSKDDLIKEIHSKFDDDIGSEITNYVSGINCSPKYAFEEMRLTKETFGKEDGILGYHAFQSFKPGEVSPEQAHEIGVELANEMWGDRFQALVSTHTNTDKVHNHFVVNSVSYLDGKKCEYSRTSYAELRHLNDSICLEHGLSVLEEKPTRKNINYSNYIKDNNDGRVDYYSLTKMDIDYAIYEAISYKDFLDLLKGLDYTVYERFGKLTIYSKECKKKIRIERRFGEGYSISNIKKRIDDISKREKPIIENINIKQYSYIKYDKDIKRHGLQGLYRYYCYILKLYPKNIRKYKLSSSMKLEARKLDELSEQAIFLADNNINTKDDLVSLKERTIIELNDMLNSKDKLSYKLKNTDNELEKEKIKNSIEKITNKAKTLRKKVKICDSIEIRVEQMEYNLKEMKNEKEVDRNEPIK
jgi:hypothetical protein